MTASLYGVVPGTVSRTAQRDAENMQLLMRARAGDAAAFEELWERALVLLRPTMFRFLAHLPRTRRSGRRVERDDLLQEGLLGAWKAVRDFDPKRGRALVHVVCRARSAMQAYLRRQVTVRRLHAEDPKNPRSANDVFAVDVPVRALPELYRDLNEPCRRAA